MICCPCVFGATLKFCQYFTNYIFTVWIRTEPRNLINEANADVPLTCIFFSNGQQGATSLAAKINPIVCPFMRKGPCFSLKAPVFKLTYSLLFYCISRGTRKTYSKKKKKKKKTFTAALIYYRQVCFSATWWLFFLLHHRDFTLG